MVYSLTALRHSPLLRKNRGFRCTVLLRGAGEVLTYHSLHLDCSQSLTLTIQTGEETSLPVETAITKAAFECSILLFWLNTGKCEKVTWNKLLQSNCLIVSMLMHWCKNKIRYLYLFEWTFVTLATTLNSITSILTSLEVYRHKCCTCFVFLLWVFFFVFFFETIMYDEL